MMKKVFLAGVVALGIGLAGSLLTHPKNDYIPSQGWSKTDLQNWYELSQGSRLIRRDWFYNLKMEDGKPLASRELFESLGYVYLAGGDKILPAGWVLDTGPAGEFVGLNCSACHTSKLKHDGKEIIVHGGQAMADFQSFMNILIDTVEKTTVDDERFAQFSKAVLGPDAAAAAKQKLRADLARWMDFRLPIHATTVTSTWGRGRADAVGIILSTTASVVQKPLANALEQQPFPESNAPVSYPFAWNANQQGVLQHNGVVDNGRDFGLIDVAKIGALIRNWTEALGVFAEVSLSDDGQKVQSSVNFANLMLIEQALAKLHSPTWPASFGALDEIRRARGEAIFLNNCASCHGKLAHDDTKTLLPLAPQPVDVKSKGHQGFVYLHPLFDDHVKPLDFKMALNPDPARFIGTDPAMACNALMHISPSGKLEGLVNAETASASPNDKNFGPKSVTMDLLRGLIQRDVLGNKTKSLATYAENQGVAAFKMFQQYAFADYEYGGAGQDVEDEPLQNLRAFLMHCADHIQVARSYRADVALPQYKARPLNGIWATAPYLHNGSVPTLYDLLLPPDERPATFSYLDGEMDVEKGGLKNANGKPGAFQFKVYSADGYAIVGNWNGGHEYGTKLDEASRRDLVEYLKGL